MYTVYIEPFYGYMKIDFKHDAFMANKSPTLFGINLVSLSMNMGPFTQALFLPRTYPPRFAKKICDLMPQLKMHGEGRPDVSGADVFSDLKAYPWSDWPEGNIIEVIRYLRGNVDLNMPNEWKACFPTKL